MEKKASETISSSVSQIDINKVKPGDYWYVDNTFSDEKVRGKKVKAIVELVENGVIYGNLTMSQLCRVESVVIRNWNELKEWIRNFKYPFGPKEYLAWYSDGQLAKVWKNQDLTRRKIKSDGQHKGFEFTSTEVGGDKAYMLYYGKVRAPFYKNVSSSIYVPIIAIKVL